MIEKPLAVSLLPNVKAASPEEVTEALSYALRFDQRGKPRKPGWDFTASLAAEYLTSRLLQAGFVIMKAGQHARIRPTR